MNKAALVLGIMLQANVYLYFFLLSRFNGSQDFSYCAGGLISIITAVVLAELKDE